LTFSPEAKIAHCKLGCCLLLTVGLYLPRSLTLLQTMVEVLPQIEHFFAILGSRNSTVRKAKLSPVGS